jgi:hypothetical protein
MGSGGAGKDASENRTRSSARSLLSVGLKTWPRKIAAAIAGAVLASAVSYFLGADFWSGVSERAGLAPEPVRVDVITDVDRFASDSGVVHVPTFVVPRPITAIGPPPNGKQPEGRYTWAHQMGGVDSTETLIRASVSGTSAAPVVLQDLQIHVNERRRPLEGSNLTFQGLGAPINVRFIEVNLDHEPPTWEYLDSQGEPADHFPFEVTETETEVFDIAAFTLRCDCLWTAELHYSTEGEEGAITIDNDGRPFRTTAVSEEAQGQYYWFNRRWRASPSS